MGRWALLLALLLAFGATISAWAGDREDCHNADSLVKTGPARAVAACRRLAEQGSAGAQLNLGVMYAKGYGVPQDYGETVKWFRKAADQGNAGAQFYLGQMYYIGQGVPQDYAEAVKWYGMAAE